MARVRSGRPTGVKERVREARQAREPKEAREAKQAREAREETTMMQFPDFCESFYETRVCLK